MNPEFIRNILAMLGEEGQQWLDSIPGIIQEYQKKWDIAVHDPFHLSYNYVAPAKRANGEDVVLKIGYPGNTDFQIELEALRAFHGRGISMLCEEDKDKNVMLTERVVPGLPVSSIENDEEATRVVAATMKKLWIPAPPGSAFPTLDSWFNGFGRLRTKFAGTTGPLPEAIVKEGEELYKYLINTSTELYLLHGDLHHENILSATREPYLSIDPQGVIGERVHETAAMLRNPQETLRKASNPRDLLRRRIEILAEELTVDPERIRQWGVAQTVLSAIWKLEDGGTDWDYCITTATLLSELKN